MGKNKSRSAIKCRATRRHLRNGTETGDLQGIRVTVAYPQKRTLHDLAKSISHASTAHVADVLAVWTAMEEEIIRTLSDGNRVELGSLGTLSLEVGPRQRKSVDEGVTNKDIEFKRVNFVGSKKLKQKLGDLSFECDGIVAHPLSEPRMVEALTEHFAIHQYITVRNFASICKCSPSTAGRRIKELIAQGKLRQSDISERMYEWVGEHE